MLTIGRNSTATLFLIVTSALLLSWCSQAFSNTCAKKVQELIDYPAVYSILAALDRFQPHASRFVSAFLLKDGFYEGSLIQLYIQELGKPVVDRNIDQMLNNIESVLTENGVTVTWDNFDLRSVQLSELGLSSMSLRLIGSRFEVRADHTGHPTIDRPQNIRVRWPRLRIRDENGDQISLFSSMSRLAATLEPGQESFLRDDYDMLMLGYLEETLHVMQYYTSPIRPLSQLYTHFLNSAMFRGLPPHHQIGWPTTAGELEHFNEAEVFALMAEIGVFNHTDLALRLAQYYWDERRGVYRYIAGSDSTPAHYPGLFSQPGSHRLGDDGFYGPPRRNDQDSL